VVNELLRPDLASGWAYRLVDYVNGLVAPSFLFLAGMIVPLALTRAGDAKPFPSQRNGWIKQAGVVLTLGYLLRSPGLRPGAWVNAGPDDWAAFWQVDVLHCIAAGWLLLLGVAALIRRRTQRLQVHLIACAGAVALTPVVWTLLPAESIPRPLANYLTPAFGSLFPLFPWIAFLSGGAALGERIQQADPRGQDRDMMRWLAGSGTVVGTLLGSATFQGVRLTSRIGWEGDPLAVVTYLSLVVAVVAAFYVAVEPSLDGFPRPSSRSPAKRTLGLRGLARIGRQSLFLYALHLVVLYRWSWNGHTLATTFEGALGWVGVAGVVTLLTAGMGAFGALWFHAQQRGSRAKWGAVGTVLLLTLLL